MKSVETFSIIFLTKDAKYVLQKICKVPNHTSFLHLFPSGWHFANDWRRKENRREIREKEEEERKSYKLYVANKKENFHCIYNLTTVW